MPTLELWLWITLGVVNIPVYVFWYWVICTDSDGRSEVDFRDPSLYLGLMTGILMLFRASARQTVFLTLCWIVACAGSVIGEAYLIEHLFL